MRVPDVGTSLCDVEPAQTARRLNVPEARPYMGNLHSRLAGLTCQRHVSTWVYANRSVSHNSDFMKKIVIMGASSGIGLAAARIFLENGMELGLAARRTDVLADLAAEFPGRVRYAAIDICSPDAPKALYALIGELGGMDLYFHVAGIGYDNPGLDPEREAAITDTDATGFARMVSAAYRWMREAGVHGQIAAVTSVAGTKGIGGMSAYSAAKKFDQTYLVAMRQLADSDCSGVTFTDIRPGWTSTALLKRGKRYPMQMTLDHVVPLILRAIRHRRRVAVIDRRWAVLVCLWRLVPDWLWVRMGRQASKLM